MMEGGGTRVAGATGQLWGRGWGDGRMSRPGTGTSKAAGVREGQGRDLGPGTPAAIPGLALLGTAATSAVGWQDPKVRP